MPCRPITTRAVAARYRPARGYTLIEVLVVVTIMGILGALVIPSASSAGSFRVQSAVRTVVSDITFAQSDAMAFQAGRALMFYPDENRYVVVEVTGPTLDPVNDVLYGSGRADGKFEVSFDDPVFGGAVLTGATFSGGTNLIFDEMGAPVTTPGGSTPSTSGVITIEGQDASYWINIDGFTGHVTTGRVNP